MFSDNSRRPTLIGLGAGILVLMAVFGLSPVRPEKLQGTFVSAPAQGFRIASPSEVWNSIMSKRPGASPSASATTPDDTTVATSKEGVGTGSTSDAKIVVTSAVRSGSAIIIEGIFTNLSVQPIAVDTSAIAFNIQDEVVHITQTQTSTVAATSETLFEWVVDRDGDHVTMVWPVNGKDITIDIPVKQ